MSQFKNHVSACLMFLFCLFLLPQYSVAHQGCGGNIINVSGDGTDLSSGPMINTPTATPMGKGHVSGSFMFSHQEYNEIPAENAHALHHDDRHIHGKRSDQYYLLSVAAGLTSDLDLALSLPVVSHAFNQVDDHASLGRHERSSGFGDLQLRGQYRFWKEHVDIAFITGVTFPSGKITNQDKSANKVETELQPGNGAWEGEFGVAMSRSFQRRVSFAQSFHYVLTGTGAQGVNTGDRFHYDAGVSVALRQMGSVPNFHAVLELNAAWAIREKDRDGESVFDSGGVLILISPGWVAQLTERLSLFASVPVPLYQNLGGEHEEMQMEVLAGISLWFA